MNNSKKKQSAVVFWTGDVILAVAAVAVVFCSVYKAIGLSTLAVAVLLALYKLLSVYSKENAKPAKRFKIVLTTLLCIGLAYFVVVEIPIISSARTDKNSEAPYLIVLGAGVDGTVPSVSLSNRLAAALEYLQTYPETIVVVSGGQGAGEEITEAECMSTWLMNNGISAERIITEDKSTSTEENIANSLDKIRENGGDPAGRVAIVSSEYHLYRAKYMAREQNAVPVGVAAHTSYPVLMLNYFIREAFAVTALWIM